jgi:hypothetical protein
VTLAKVTQATWHGRWVRDVFVVEPAHDRHIWICVAIGFALGAVLCEGALGLALLICGAIGALIAWI